VTARSPTSVPTIGEIARRLGVPLHKVEYVIRARGIAPTGWAGNARVFTDADVARIGSELKRIAAEKEGNSNG
jgi:DNA-binding transcriptional MerR regulator